MNTNRKTVEKVMRTIQSLPDPTSEAKPTSREVAALSRDIARSFAEAVRRNTKAEIEAWTLYEKRDLKPEDLVQNAADRRLDSTSFGDLERLARDDPQRALDRWEEVKAAARADLTSGWQAGRALRDENSDDAWDQACYLAVREQFETLWPPRNGVESMMLDEVVQYEMYRRTVLKALWRIRPDSLYESPGKLLQALDRIQRLFQLALQTFLSVRRSRMPVVAVKEAVGNGEATT